MHLPSFSRKIHDDEGSPDQNTYISITTNHYHNDNVYVDDKKT